ncbi:MAG: peptide chain release factor 1 [Gammaproteobacteria bacterium RIFCSPHIGHO2_12_FULL_38_11]|nr:MAG: peptide chain release factor 1 [Gammaproteobacteria bacterium RIFCSPHIGHO2_12_FULL_38_11]
MITKEKWTQLLRKMQSLGINEADLLEKFILGSGSGGQKINKTSSCVWIKHLPTSITVKCQQDRSRTMNRYFARLRLCEKIDTLINKEKSDTKQLIEKIRRQKKKRTRKAKRKMLADKRHQSNRKQTRQSPQGENE